jgi:hypothetical protein
VKAPRLRSPCCSGRATRSRWSRLAHLPDGVAYMPKPWRALDVLIAAEKVLTRKPAQV